MWQSGYIRFVLCVGGLRKSSQEPYLVDARFIGGTPGRLEDFVDSGKLDVSSVWFLILDEADRMLHQGFEESVKSLAKGTKQDRQTMFFTATWPASVRELAKSLSRGSEQVLIECSQEVNAETGEQEPTVHENIEQQVVVFDRPYDDWRAQEEDKKLYLWRYICRQVKDERSKILIFVNSKVYAEKLVSELQFNDVENCNCIHGDKRQEERSAINQ
jgi:superfamily II DNA/RNA helicase